MLILVSGPKRKPKDKGKGASPYSEGDKFSKKAASRGFFRALKSCTSIKMKV